MTAIATGAAQTWCGYPFDKTLDVDNASDYDIGYIFSIDGCAYVVVSIDPSDDAAAGIGDKGTVYLAKHSLAKSMEATP